MMITITKRQKRRKIAIELCDRLSYPVTKLLLNLILLYGHDQDKTDEWLQELGLLLETVGQIQIGDFEKFEKLSEKDYKKSLFKYFPNLDMAKYQIRVLLHQYIKETNDEYGIYFVMTNDLVFDVFYYFSMFESRLIRMFQKRRNYKDYEYRCVVENILKENSDVDELLDKEDEDGNKSNSPD